MKLFAFLSLVALASAHFQYTEEFQDWKTKYNKKYDTSDIELERQTIWEANKNYVLNHNANADKFGFILTMNEFADLDAGEFATIYNGLLPRPANYSNTKNLYKSSGLKVADTVDWRQKGAVTGVKNQGHCGSCWSFSATGSLEGQNFLKNNRLVSLSEQQLMDCSTSFGNHGCKGGLMDNAFRYLETVAGDDTESSYPYLAEDSVCRYNSANVGGTCSGFQDIPSGDENALKDAVANVGPISVAIDAGHSSFQLYHSGVYYSSQCSSTKLDHGVLAVGYGTDNGEDYWLVKNSWGASWGMEGYIKMSRNRGNNCGIATQASYPKA